MLSSLCCTLLLLAGPTLASSRYQDLRINPQVEKPKPAGKSKQAGAGTASVDLDYEVHTATLNETGGYYTFSNIPYADQPTGDKRFQKAQLPTGKSSTANNGTVNSICYQAYPQWVVEQQATTNKISVDAMKQTLYDLPDQTEACLMLDVYVPSKVWAASSDSYGKTKTPVLIWTHGGGFTFGSKLSVGNPAGILARSTLADNDGIIFVSINYRLGLYGWLGGGPDTKPNLGLHDQRLAYDWVQRYIARFGGDPKQVTVMGESAGAASILHHITSYGGGGDARLPFQRAILQSPAFQTAINTTDAYARTLAAAANAAAGPVAGVAALAKLDAAALRRANADVVYASAMGAFSFGPTPDGDYVPALPQVLLAEGKLHKDVDAMAAHTSLEAAPFASAAIKTEADLTASLKQSYPRASDATLAKILALYPLSVYTSHFLRAVQIGSDSLFSCATRYLATALGEDTYNYIFAVPPGYHGQDLAYTFFNGDTTTPNMGTPVDAALAQAMQDYYVGFTMSGDPNDAPAATALKFPTYGAQSTVVEIASTGLRTTKDDMDNDRCPWWQEAFVKGLI